MIDRDKDGEDERPRIVEARDCDVCGEEFVVSVDSDTTVCDREHDN